MLRAIPKLLVIVGVIAACVFAIAPQFQERFGPVFPPADDQRHLVTVTANNETRIDPAFERFIADLLHTGQARLGRLHVDMSHTKSIKIGDGHVEFDDPVRVTYLGWLVRPSTTVTKVYSEPDQRRVRIDIDGLPDYYLTTDAELERIAGHKQREAIGLSGVAAEAKKRQEADAAKAELEYRNYQSADGSPVETVQDWPLEACSECGGAYKCSICQGTGKLHVQKGKGSP